MLPLLISVVAFVVVVAVLLRLRRQGKLFSGEAPEWTLKPAAAWGWLAFFIVAMTPGSLFEASSDVERAGMAAQLPVNIYALTVIWRDRQARGRRTVWNLVWLVLLWTLAPLAYLGFVYRRRWQLRSTSPSPVTSAAA